MDKVKKCKIIPFEEIKDGFTIPIKVKTPVNFIAEYLLEKYNLVSATLIVHNNDEDPFIETGFACMENMSNPYYVDDVLKFVLDNKIY